MLAFNSTSTPSDCHAQQLFLELEQERTALWRLYSELALYKSSFGSAEIKPLLSQFSQLLMDYICLGHFGIYEYLSVHAKGRRDLAEFANRAYPVFSNTTDTAVSFNDEYDVFKRKFKTDNLATDLSVLGEKLVKRMEVEDRLCSLLLG